MWLNSGVGTDLACVFLGKQGSKNWFAVVMSDLNASYLFMSHKVLIRIKVDMRGQGSWKKTIFDKGSFEEAFSSIPFWSEFYFMNSWQ